VWGAVHISEAKYATSTSSPGEVSICESLYHAELM
jgi:hypothetical protein